MLPLSYEKEPCTAVQAREAAQRLAFAPFMFQAARCLRRLGVLAALAEHPQEGLAAETLQQALPKLSAYALRVLLEAGLGLGLVLEREDRYCLSKTGWFWQHDALTIANADFTHDVNYLGLFHLEEALQTGQPEGLKVFGDWPTIYQALTELPEPVRQSWFAFDHHYSDAAFAAALPKVFAHAPQQLLDIGGNTGKWALACLAFDAEVNITLADLPGQLAVAQQAVQSPRCHFLAVDMLKNTPLPGAWPAIWLSQFLDCFSDAQIITILQRCKAALAEGGRVWILEPFWDEQRFASAALALQMTSLYFTALANGHSQMYRSTVFEGLIHTAGLRVVERYSGLGAGHSLWACQ